MELPEFTQFNIVAVVADGGSYSSTRQVWSVIYDKVFEFTKHSTDQNSLSAVPGLWPHMVWWSTHLLQEFNYHPPYRLDLAPCDFHLFLHLQEIPVWSASVFSEWQRGGDECHTVVLWHRTQKLVPRYDKCLNFGDMLNSSILAVSVQINLFIKLGSVSVNGTSETYFLVVLLIYNS